MRVLLVCPRGVKTGGPEAIHQLGEELNHQGVDARLIDPSFIGRFLGPVKEYEEYKPRWTRNFNSFKPDFVVFPETATQWPNRWNASGGTQRVVWWLSVDNAEDTGVKSLLSTRQNLDPNLWDTNTGYVGLGVKKKISNIVRAVDRTLNFEPFGSMGSVHLTQSVYARRFLSEQLALDSTMLSDFIRRVERPITSKICGEKNGLPLVVFNGAKGGDLVRQVQPFAPGVEFRPLVNMSGEEIRESLASADLYLDLGHFPGKDRLPREAALLDCPVLLAKRGSAAVKEDFPLGDDALIDIFALGPSEVASIVVAHLANPQRIRSGQKAFKSQVLGDLVQFRKEVEEVVNILKARLPIS